MCVAGDFSAFTIAEVIVHALMNILYITTDVVIAIGVLSSMHGNCPKPYFDVG